MDASMAKGASSGQDCSSGASSKLSFRVLAPNGARDAALSYSPGVFVSGRARTIYVSGQIGVDGSGQVSPDFETQVRQAWKNIATVLAAGDMRLSDIVKITTFLIDRADLPIASRVRAELLGDHKPASTLVYVVGLVNPDWYVEIEAIAIAPA